MWWKITITVAILLVCLIWLALLYGAKRRQSVTRTLQVTMEAARTPVTPGAYDPRELEGLPAPVQRYFHTVLQEGQPLVAAVSVEHTGTLNMSDTGEHWKPFTSRQHVITRRPGFVWDARIRLAPAISVFVNDAYIAGKGILTAAVAGLVPVLNQPHSPELAEGELMRFFAEAAWYPTALLPSQGVIWEVVDDSSAKATLKDGNTMLSLLFRFTVNGLIESVYVEARGRSVAGTVIPTPWEGRWRNYEQCGGMRIPLEGEVAWLLPDGPHPYWRGRITTISYEFAE